MRADSRGRDERAYEATIKVVFFVDSHHAGMQDDSWIIECRRRIVYATPLPFLQTCLISTLLYTLTGRVPTPAKGA